MSVRQRIRKAVGSAAAAIENSAALLALAAVLLLSVGEVIARLVFRSSVPSSAALVSHLSMLLACAGASVASREGRQLGLVDPLRPRGLVSAVLGSLRASVSSAVLSALTVASVSMPLQAFEPSARAAFLPVRWVAMALALAFFSILFRSGLRELRKHPVAYFVGIACGLFASSGAAVSVLGALSVVPPPLLLHLPDRWAAFISAGYWPLVAILVLSAFGGTPFFLVLAGVAYLSFAWSQGVVEAVPFQAYTMLTGNVIPAIPLFTLAGYVLADSGAGQRLVGLFRAAFGWMRGGPAVAAIIACAFFTTFTGASGVTILALGGLVSHTLKDSGYSEGQAEGILASSASLSVMFPPSLAVIVYASVAHLNVMDLFVGGAFPGLLLVASMCAAMVFLDAGTKRIPFSGKTLLGAARSSLGELILPFLVMAGYFSGRFNLVETGSLVAAYSIILVVVVRRDLPFRAFLSSAVKSVPVAGGVLIVLAAARGLSDFLVDARVPLALSDYCQRFLPSQWAFLLALNGALLLAGCLMDLFAAILVIAPLVIPLAGLYGVNPTHLGIIFLTNLCLGFLTPPLGVNLFTASSAFNKPMQRMSAAVLPYAAIQLAVVLLVTFVPALTTLFLN